MPMTENDNIMIVAVCLAANVPKIFHYAVPKNTELAPGQFVLVPFGRKKLPGESNEEKEGHFFFVATGKDNPVSMQECKRKQLRAWRASLGKLL